MENQTLLILDFVSEGKISVDDAVHLIEALEDQPVPEIWVVPFRQSPSLEICLN